MAQLESIYGSQKSITLPFFDQFSKHLCLKSSTFTAQLLYFHVNFHLKQSIHIHQHRNVHFSKRWCKLNLSTCIKEGITQSIFDQFSKSLCLKTSSFNEKQLFIHFFIWSNFYQVKFLFECWSFWPFYLISKKNNVIL